MKENPTIEPPNMQFSELRAERVVATLRRLESRIEARFPNSGLSRVASELVALAETSDRDVERLRRPYWLARVVAVAAVAILMTLAALLFENVRSGSFGAMRPTETLQAVESAVNDVLFLSLGVFFAFTLEKRWKRRDALKSLNRFRSVIHVVDMHQLTKDPEYFVNPQAMSSGVSPVRRMTRFEMVRYLDYCSELFSLTSKAAALYLQHMDDEVVLETVNEIESLSTGLSQKVWQKIMILDGDRRTAATT